LDSLTLHLLLVALVITLKSQVQQVPGFVHLAFETLDGVVDAVGRTGGREREGGRGKLGGSSIPRNRHP